MKLQEIPERCVRNDLRMSVGRGQNVSTLQDHLLSIEVQWLSPPLR
jgi:hypothetical protein